MIFPLCKLLYVSLQTLRTYPAFPPNTYRSNQMSILTPSDPRVPAPCELAPRVPAPPSWHQFLLVEDTTWNKNFLRMGGSVLPPHFGTPITTDGKYIDDGKTRVDYVRSGILRLVSKHEPIIRSEMDRNLLMIYTVSDLTIQVVFSRLIDAKFPNDVICVNFLRCGGSGFHIDAVVKAVVADIEASFEVRGGAFVYD
jgi:hypothetical protein